MDATELCSDSLAQPQVVFRGRKRKAFRQRADPAVEEAHQAKESTPTQDPATPDVSESSAPQPDVRKDDQDQDTEISVAELLRRRNAARKARLGGVAFGAEAAARSDNDDDAMGDELSLMIREEENRMQSAAEAANNRFVHQTGLSKEVTNKHMTEFIEAQLAKRYNSATSSEAAPSSAGLSTDGDEQFARLSSMHAPNAPGRDKHTALQGKILEIDLGDEVRSRNEAMTDRARRKLEGEDFEEDPASGPAKKVRLGRDGKPWRPKNRRGSDAIARDQLVEELMRENKVDNFERPVEVDPVRGADDEEEFATNDDRIAEEFRREFMEAMSQRRQARKKTIPVNAPRQPARNDQEILKGPKLGGSRNARAAMRDILLAQQQQQAGKR